MKLNEFLSLEPSKESCQIQGFLMGRKLNYGSFRKADVGVISLRGRLKNTAKCRSAKADQNTNK